jgi:hypothetical protein
MMEPEVIDFFIRLGIFVGLLYMVFFVRLFFAYRRWIQRKSSWGKFWPYYHHCEGKTFDYLMMTLAKAVVIAAIVIVIVWPLIILRMKEICQS